MGVISLILYLTASAIVFFVIDYIDDFNKKHGNPVYEGPDRMLLSVIFWPCFFIWLGKVIGHKIFKLFIDID